MNLTDPITKRRIPFNEEIETIVLGSIIRNNDLMQYFTFITPEDFHHKINADIFAAMEKLNFKAEAISPFTIPKYLTEVSVYDIVGGASKYLARVTAMGDKARGMEITYAKAVGDMSARRKLADYWEGKALEICKENDDRELYQHIEDARENLDKIKIGQPELFIHNRKTTEQIIEAINTEIPCFSTGFDKLDKVMDGGLYAGKSYGFAARKKVGKTSWVATLSYNLNQAGVDHLFICGEMSAKEVQQRILSRAADIWPTAFRSNYGKSLDCQNRLLDAMNAMPTHTYFQNAPGMSFTSLKHACKMAVEKKKVKGIILDYLQLVRGKPGNMSTSEHLDEVAQWLADFARQYNIFNITTAQINQEGNTRGGEGIRLAFDQVFEIHREDKAQPHTWLEMLETRYTPWANIGDEIVPGFKLAEKGTWFEPFV